MKCGHQGRDAAGACGYETRLDRCCHVFSLLRNWSMEGSGDWGPGDTAEVAADRTFRWRGSFPATGCYISLFAEPTLFSFYLGTSAKWVKILWRKECHLTGNTCGIGIPKKHINVGL